MKQIIGLVVIALAIWASVGLFGGHEPVSATAVAFKSSKDCATCHATQYDEWHSGPHADAWTGTAVRKLSQNFATQDCIDCHAPQPIFTTGIGKRVLPRTARRAEGVDCISCHALPNGRVAGTTTSDSAACLPTETLDLTRPEFCAGCHDQHLTVQQWRDSQWPARGKDCVDCHMPWRDGTPSGGRFHGMHGGSDPQMVRDAVVLRGTLDATDGGAKSWVVELENVGAGHSFPTDERSRAADVFWRPLSEPNGPWNHLYRFRSPYRFETDIPDTLLLAHATQRMVVERVDGEQHTPVTEPIEVVLMYKRSPHYRDMTNPMQDLWPTDPAIDPYATDIPSDARVVYRIELGTGAASSAGEQR